MKDPESRRRVVIGYPPVPEGWNAITRKVIGCAMEVHRGLGPGLLERIYEEALCYELTTGGLAFERQMPIKLRYKEIELPEQRLDLMVENLLVVELKSVERVPDIFLAQLVSYLRSADLPLGLLLNFNCTLLKEGIYRRVNPAAAAFERLTPVSSLCSSDPSGDSEFDF
jgi:GxxExxY protein